MWGAIEVVTIKDVATMAGVSPSTVSRVLNAKMVVRKETEERVWAAVEDLGYRPNALARALITNQTSAVGIIVSDVCDPFFPPIVQGLTEVANVNHYSSFLCDLSPQPEEVFYLRLVHEQRVDGVVIATSRIPDEHIFALMDEGVPLVLINRRMEGAPWVEGDNEHGARQATLHLVEGGHKRIAHIATPSDVKSGVLRRKGYEDVLREQGLPVTSELILVEEATTEGGYRAGKVLLSRKEHPTAVFAFDDMVAIGAMQAFLEEGVGVPGDIAVVGYDDILLARYVTPSLTTIEQPKRQMGNLAMEMLIRVIRGEDLEAREVVLKPELIVRQSSMSLSRRGSVQSALRGLPVEERR